MFDKIYFFFNKAYFALRSLFGGKIFSFIGIILFNWYVVISACGLFAFYYFLKGLYDSGILNRIANFIFPILIKLVSLVKGCTPFLIKFNELLKCFQNYSLD